MFNTFWQNFPRKEGKKKAQALFEKLPREKQLKAIDDCQTRYSGIERCFIPLPTTYLSGERFDDDPIPRKPEKVNWDELASKHAKPGETFEQFKARYKPS